MNVDDIETKIPEPNPQQDRLDLIFARQRSLMEKYHKIEADNNLLQTHHIPVDLDDRFGQARLKDFAWRTTEELTEAVDAHSLTHQREEVSDALHFLVELIILSGWTSEQLFQDFTIFRFKSPLPWKGECRLKNMFGVERGRSDTPQDTVPRHHYLFAANIYPVIHHLGCAMNCLKNKPWKQTHHITDKQFFYRHITQTFSMFVQLAIYLDFDEDSLYRMYWKKSAVNKFRQRSGY